MSFLSGKTGRRGNTSENKFKDNKGAYVEKKVMPESNYLGPSIDL